MSFGKETVRKVAELARMQLTDAETEKFAEQLGQVLKYIETLNEVDTAGVDPMTHALELTTPMRAVDEAWQSPGVTTMLESAPDSLHDSYKVPQVLGGGH